jgi:WD40 repeat protein
LQPLTPCAPEKTKLTSKAVIRFVALWIVTSAFFVLVTACNTTNGGFLPTSSLPPSPVATATDTPLPDLAAISMEFGTEVALQCYDASTLLGIRVTLENRGTAGSGPFSLRLNDLEHSIPSGLAAGERLTLWFPGYSPQNILVIDPGQQVQESNKTNNQLISPYIAPALLPACPTPTLSQILIIGERSILEGHSGKVLSVDFSPDGRLLASGSTDNTLRLWNVRQSTLLRTMLGHPFPILSLSFSPNNQLIATGSDDGIVRIWQVSNGSLLHSLQGHAGWVNKVVFSPDGKSLSSASDDYTVRQWRVSDGRLNRVIDEGMGRVLDLIYSPSGQALAWCESNGAMRVWQIGDGKWLQVLNLADQRANTIAYSPEGALLAAGLENGTILIWRTSDWSATEISSAHQGSIETLSFSPNGAFLATGGADGEIKLWKIQASGDRGEIQTTQFATLTGHTSQVYSLDFSPDGKLLAAGAADNTIRLWEPPEQ